MFFFSSVRVRVLALFSASLSHTLSAVVFFPLGRYPSNSYLLSFFVVFGIYIGIDAIWLSLFSSRQFLSLDYECYLCRHRITTTIVTANRHEHLPSTYWRLVCTLASDRHNNLNYIIYSYWLLLALQFERRETRAYSHTHTFTRNLDGF